MVFAWYFSNYTYISTSLCSNLDLPELNCDGKCILAEKLRLLELEAENNARDSQQSVPDVRLKPLLALEPLSIELLLPERTLVQSSPYHRNWSVAESEFHNTVPPPRFA